MGFIARFLHFFGIPTSWHQLFPGHGKALQHFLSFFPFLFSCLFLFFSVYINCVLQVVNQRRHENHAPPLSDIGHYFLPWVIYPGNTQGNKVHDLYAAVFGAVTAFRFIWTGRLFITMLRRWFFIWGIMFLFRGFALGLTQYPYTDGNYPPLCIPILSPGHNTWMLGWYVMFGIDSNFTCADYMFSGHTTILTLLALQWTQYSKNDFAACINLNTKPKFVRRLLRPTLSSTGDSTSCWLIPILAWCTMAGGVIVIIAGRIHYSIDCLVAWAMTLSYYKLYFYYLKSVYERDTYISRFIIWFEGLSLPPTLQEIKQRSATDEENITTSDLYIYQPSMKQLAVYPSVYQQQQMQLQQQLQSSTLDQYQASQSEYPVVMLTVPNEVNPTKPLEYYYPPQRTASVAVAASGTPLNWGVPMDRQ